MKVDEAEIIVSEKIAKEQLGTFYNSVYSNNYEYTEKALDMPEEENKDNEEEEVDPRTKKITKALANVSLYLKDGGS